MTVIVLQASRDLDKLLEGAANVYQIRSKPNNIV